MKGFSNFLNKYLELKHQLKNSQKGNISKFYVKL